MYGLPLLYPYGNCSREMDPQTLNLYLTSTQPDSFKTYAVVKQRKDTRPVHQPDGDYLVTNLTIIPMLLTEDRATSYHQCMSFYCHEPPNNQSCTTTKRLTGMSVTMSPHYPSVMLTAVYQEPQFVGVVPMAPLTSRGEAVYTYYMLFGDSLPKPTFTVPSIGLMPKSTSQINITLEGTSLVNKNSQLTGDRGWLPLQAWDVVWIQGTGEKPSLTKLTSTEPVAVFTGMARENQSGFSYVNMHTHQMPDTQQWGSLFLADLSHTQLLQEQNVIVAFRLLTANSSTVHVTTYPTKSTQRLEMEPGKPETLALPSIKDKDFPTHILIQGSEKLLILYEAYTPTAEGNATLFSHLLQPVEWHTYKQLALLVPTLEMRGPAQVSIAVIAPSTASVLVQTNTLTPVTLAEYERFQRVESAKVSDYTIHQIRMETHLLENSSLVFTARDSEGRRDRLGVTVYSYSPQSSYAHTNLPVLSECMQHICTHTACMYMYTHMCTHLDDNITQRISTGGRRSVDQCMVTAIASSAGATLLLVLILVPVTIGVLALMRPRVLFQKPDPPIEGEIL